ncbi:RsmB/NOP family class I SAM-dependent RNA methyltransferase [Shewanella psychrophila]|uniref:RsmB/NOP family class I SAM-dependent RNA methyltransferase n=1 Tax=Shewanella psychrophila TaxID=225848 RepID=UPI00098AD75E|nr:RsmB/NOP family class I SAM-dependent RNA methyltransferase [Shewanella psychrophila]
MTFLNEVKATSFEAISAETPAQKRALSYANTILQLFTQVMEKQQPADRVVGEYFRINKKHGSKDRRVIRESLFALFRWWGWLNKFNTNTGTNTGTSTVNTGTQAWFTMLTVNARLESHSWEPFITAWAGFSGQEKQLSLDGETRLENASEKCDWLTEQFPAIRFSTDELVPDWFWQTCPTQDAEQRLAMVEALSSRPPIWARVQNIDIDEAIDKLAKLDITATASEYFSDSISLGHKSINLNGMSLYREGELEIQDLGSQVVGQICAPNPNDNWWDTCSGAGGKSLQLRSLMLAQDKQAKGTIVASDVRRKPLEELAKRAKRASFRGITASPWKSDELPVPPNHFDGVLVDAPCSCTGTWRRNPDMRWIDVIDSVNDKPNLQLDILTRSSRAVKVGGTLVYATCSLSPLENEDVVNAFLAKHSKFELEITRHPFTGIEATMHTVLPYQADTDGMFVARMKRKS